MRGPVACRVRSVRGISLATAYRHIREGRRHFEAALARWKEEHRDRGVLTLPLTTQALLDADRAIPKAPDHVLAFAWFHAQRALGRTAPEADGVSAAPPHAPGTADAPPMPLPPRP